jgi:single-strand DNA-binding protein
MASFNKVLLSGNLGHSPELRFTPKGTPVVELSLATDRRTKSGDEWVDRTDWHKVELYGKTAEIAARYLTKGSPVFIEGSLRMDHWVDKETQQPRSKIKVFGDRVHFLPRAKPSQGPDVVPMSIEPDEAAEEEAPF